MREVAEEEAEGCTAITSASGDEGNWEAAIEQFEWQGKKGLQHVSHYNALMTVFWRCRQEERSIPLFDAMKAKGVEPNVRSYNRIIAAHGACGWWDDMAETYNAMPAEGLAPDNSSKNLMVAAYASDGQWQLVAELCKEMKTASVELYPSSYSLIIDAYGSAGQMRQAEAAFKEMKAAGVAPTVMSYDAIICAYVRSKMWARAEAAFKEMRGEGLQLEDRTYDAFVSALSDAGQRRLASEVQHEQGLTESTHFFGLCATANTVPVYDELPSTSEDDAAVGSGDDYIPGNSSESSSDDEFASALGCNSWRGFRSHQPPRQRRHTKNMDPPGGSLQQAWRAVLQTDGVTSQRVGSLRIGEPQILRRYSEEDRTAEEALKDMVKGAGLQRPKSLVSVNGKPVCVGDLFDPRVSQLWNAHIEGAESIACSGTGTGVRPT